MLCHFSLWRAISNQLLSWICAAFISLFTGSLHFLFGLPCGCDWERQLNRVFLGMRWSGILARCPSHTRQCFMSLTVMVSWSLHCSLVILEVILSSHCLMLVIPSTVRIQRWWNVFSGFRCFLSRIQHSPHAAALRAHKLHRPVSGGKKKKRLVLVKTAFCKAPNALEVLATSTSIRLSAVIIDLRH